MIRQKILLFLTVLIFNVKAVEIYNNDQTTESSWFKDWRKPIIKHQSSNNQIAQMSTTPAHPKNLEPDATIEPEHLELKATDSNLETPMGISKIDKAAASIETAVKMPTSISPLPATTSEEPVVEIKPKRRMFNFGFQQESEVPNAPSRVITWIPETITESKLTPILTVSPKFPNASPVISLVPASIVKSEPSVAPPASSPAPPAKDISIKSNPLHRTFDFESTSNDNTVKELPLTSSSGGSLATTETFISSMSPAALDGDKSYHLKILPKYNTLFASTTQPSFTVREILNESPSSTLWIPEKINESTLSPTFPPTTKDLNYEIKPRRRTFNFGPTQYTYTETPSTTISWTTHVTTEESKEPPTQFVSYSNEPPHSDKYSSELGLSSPPTPVERHMAPKFSATLISSSIDYVCPSSNGYYRLANDCEKFIKCEELIPATYECAPGLKFNSYAEWGHDPCSAEVQCKTVIVRPEPEVKLSASFVRKLSMFICPKSEGYFISENDCEQFIKCEKSIASLYKCASGLQFNRYASWIHDPCENESVVGCKAVVVHPPPPELKISAALILDRVADYSCPTANGYHRLENDCDKFIKCENSIASSYKCNPGLQFNAYAVWGADPCANSDIVRCKTVIIHPTHEPSLSAKLITRVYNFSCPATNGYYSTESYCDQFYMCEKSIAYLYKCATGTQFNRYATWGQDPCTDEKLIRCQIVVIQPRPEPKFSADLVTRQIAHYECTSSEGYFKYEKDCDKFVRCEKSLPSLFKCWEGFQFNNDTAWGEDPCAREEIISCKVENVKDPEPKFSATVISKILFDFKCPANNGYFDSKHECEEFIKCENGVASLYRCLPGLQFNRISSWGEDPCANEELVHCKPVVEPLPKPLFSADLVSRRVWDFVCISNGYFKHGDECENFVKCENSIASMYKCWSGLQFNVQALWGQDPCASESAVHCKAVSPRPVFSAILISSHLEDFSCEESNGYLSIDNNCERFVKCEMFIPSLYMCPKGLQFNRRARFGEDPCASASTVRCENRPATTTTLAPISSYKLIMRPVSRYNCLAANGYFSVKDECNLFIECKNYLPSLYRCNSGLHFNQNVRRGTDVCVLPSIARCETALKKPPGPIEHHENFQCTERDGMFPLDAFECSKFVMCENGRATVMPCPPGLVFNAELQNCDWPVNVQSCNPELFRGFSCPATENDEYGGTGGTIIMFKFEQSCTQYIACQQGHPRLLSCNKGLYFSEEYQACVGSDKVPSCTN